MHLGLMDRSLAIERPRQRNQTWDFPSAYCEVLLGFVVLIEVNAGSVVLLHGVAGQQLTDKQVQKHSYIMKF